MPAHFVALEGFEISSWFRQTIEERIARLERTPITTKRRWIC